jgi:hypothetical protein
LCIPQGCISSDIYVPKRETQVEEKQTHKQKTWTESQLWKIALRCAHQARGISMPCLAAAFRSVRRRVFRCPGTRRGQWHLRGFSRPKRSKAAAVMLTLINKRGSYTCMRQETQSGSGAMSRARQGRPKSEFSFHTRYLYDLLFGRFLLPFPGLGLLLYFLLFFFVFFFLLTL